jgi:asparagine synthase (glutamine-hydrolysing)
MCGIAGFFERHAVDSQQMRAIAQSMGDAIAHRGPDDHDVAIDAQLGVALAHRRLAIVDLSPEGHQPMASASGRYLMVFNGEIYNFPELRAQLDQERPGICWRGHSDTEVFLAACEAWGFEAALKRANGMFAIAMLDRKEHQLLFARDRLGEKPLYFGWSGSTFLFASELKSLLKHPSFRRRLDPNSLQQYLRFGYVPAPHSIYAGIHKLPPAHLLALNLDAEASTPTMRAYWSVPLPMARKETVAEEDDIDMLESLLRDAVRVRMHADVPLGAFLSGGIDSSTIVALAQAQSSTPVRTFSIGFRERVHDESEHARAVASELGTRHTELFVTAPDALAVVPQLPELYDEPFADSSQIPTYLLARLTREHVTVSLSGDGGDELFGGYARYFHGRHVIAFNATIPRTLRSFAANVMSSIPGRNWDRLLSFGPASLALQLEGDRLAKLANVVRMDGAREIYKRLVSQWDEPREFFRTGTEWPTPLDDVDLAARLQPPMSWMMYMDQLTYLPDDILVKVDRASMAVALEARVPFLDPRVVSFAASLPLRSKVRANRGKWLLRKVLYRHLRSELFDRPKQGFGFPLAEWLRGPLREWADELLSPAALKDSGFASVAAVRGPWEAHLSGRQNLHYPIWVLLMYQAWFKQYRPEMP